MGRQERNRTMKILVVGSGGREHAICWALQHTSSDRLEVFCAPGNAGIAQVAQCVAIKAGDSKGLASFAENSGVDLTVVGPEAPLAQGLVDVFEKRGLKIVGPTSAAARLESSKAFAKDFMRRHWIPTSHYRVATSFDEAKEVLRSGEFGDANNSVVIKADGLAAGKGVFVAANRHQAFAAVDDLRNGAAGPEAAGKIVIEEALTGPEVSVLLFSDGHDYRLMPRRVIISESEKMIRVQTPAAWALSPTQLSLIARRLIGLRAKSSSRPSPAVVTKIFRFEASCLLALC